MLNGETMATAKNLNPKPMKLVIVRKTNQKTQPLDSL